jgi:hypothetical protein
MLAAIFFSISIVAFGQFAIFYWRAVLSGVAAQPVSARVLDSAGIEGGHVSARHFPVFAELHDLTADLDPSAGGLGVVRTYYQMIRALDLLIGSHFPQMAAWTDRESVLCARYAAVQIDRHLQANLAVAASLRSC